METHPVYRDHYEHALDMLDVHGRFLKDNGRPLTIARISDGDWELWVELHGHNGLIVKWWTDGNAIVRDEAYKNQPIPEYLKNHWRRRSGNIMFAGTYSDSVIDDGLLMNMMGGGYGQFQIHAVKYVRGGRRVASSMKLTRHEFPTFRELHEELRKFIEQTRHATIPLPKAPKGSKRKAL